MARNIRAKTRQICPRLFLIFLINTKDNTVLAALNDHQINS